jgi:hypothetical protein
MKDGRTESGFSLRPAAASEVRLAWLQRGVRSTAARARFDVDPAVGTVVWHDERGKPTTFRTPRTAADPTADDVLAEVCVATQTQTGIFGLGDWRYLLLVNGQGRTVGRVHKQAAGAFDEMWGKAGLERLESVGVRVAGRRFATVRDIERAHAGAVPRWWLHTAPYSWLIFTAVLVAALVAAVLLINAFD